MALNPVERLNVFDSDLRKELRSRSLSKNLVQVRAPFLRFTTATDMSDIESVPSLGQGFVDYKDCKFFTLGLHGWDNKNYSAADLYGTQAAKGLVVGTTYRQSSGQQVLVHTHGGPQRVTTRSDGAMVITAAQSPENYPPPGITSAKVERVRSGNVLKVQLEIQCHTQEQLEVLDAMCFIAGMTCILEWGHILTTPNGIQELITLDYKKERVQEDIALARSRSRSEFIELWCKPNKFNYDFAVVKIANVKTTVQNNIYNVSLTAYGEGDNILYLSAYATSNPLSGDINPEEAVVKSVSEYFKMAGQFSSFLKDNVDNTTGNIIRFYDPVDRAQIPNNVPTAMDSGTTNDLGLEDSYFINFAYFIDEIINGAVLRIVRSATGNISLDRLISPLVASGEDKIIVGYNQFLRSSNPETMIIFNKEAIADANKRTNNAAQVNNLVNRIPGIGDTAPAASGTDNQQTAYRAMEGKSFASEVTTISGVTNLATGVWLNSKAIQAAFLNARTIMEGFETLLRNINAATENYWDLKLFYDDDRQEFRILDDNSRDPQFNSQDKIYEFNKRLSKLDTDTIGPDVLDIQIATDYPKMLFSQLAVSGINGGNLANLPQRRDADFANTKLKDIFAKVLTPPATTQRSAAPPAYPAGTMNVTQLSTNLSTALYGDNSTTTTQSNIGNLLSPFTAGGATGVPPQVANFITDIFKNKRLLDVNTARRYRDTFQGFIKQSLITEQQAASITALFALRAKAIITRDKRIEKEQAIESLKAYNTANNYPLFNRFTDTVFTRLDETIEKQVEKSKLEFIQIIDGAAADQLKVITEMQEKQQQAVRYGRGGP